MNGGTKARITATERRVQVAELYIKGARQSAIAKRFGVTQQTISKDLKAIRKQWIQETTLSLDEHKSQELTKIDNLEREYWAQYELSKRDKTVTTERQGLRDAGTGKGKTAEKVKRVEQREGNPRWLERVEWCINTRIKILGIEAPKKSSVQSIDLTQFTPAMLQRVASGEAPMQVLIDSYTRGEE